MRETVSLGTFEMNANPDPVQGGVGRKAGEEVRVTLCHLES